MASLLVGLAPTLRAQPNGFDWQTSGAINTAQDQVRDIVVDSLNGCIYVVGLVDGISDYGLIATNLGKDGFLLKLNLNGGLIWAQTFGGTSDDELNAVALGPDGNIYVTGSFSGTFSATTISQGGASYTSGNGKDIVIASYTPSGTRRWIRTINGPHGDDRGTGIVALATGVYVTGDYDERIFFVGSTVFTSEAHNTQNIFLARYDLDGTFMNSCSGGSNGDDLGGKLSSDGNALYTTGYFNNSALRWRNMSGTITHQYSGLSSNKNMYIGSFDLNCQPSWLKYILNPGTDDITYGAIAVGQNPCSPLVVAGSTHSGSTFPGFGVVTPTGNPHDHLFLAGMDRSTGTTQWVRTAVGTGDHNTTGLDLHVDQYGNVYMAGRFKGQIVFDNGMSATGSNDWDMFATRFTSYGLPEWVFNRNGNNDDVLQAIAVGDQGDVYLGGYANDNNFFLGRITDTEATYWPRNPTRFSPIPSICSNSAPFDLSTLLKPFQKKHATAVVTSSGLSSAADALGPPDNVGVQFNNNNSTLTLQLSDTIAAGDAFLLYWRKASLALGTAIPLIEVSVNGTNWTTITPNISTTNESYFAKAIQVSVPTVYVRITKTSGLSSTSFLVDGIVHLTGTRSGGTWSGAGVSGTMFDPTGLSGSIPITYTVGQSGCTRSTTRNVFVQQAPTASISYPGNPYCGAAGTVLPVITGNASGTFSITPASGLSINSASGAINTTSTTPGTYTVTYTVPANNACAAITATVNVTIATPPSAVISYPGAPFCANEGPKNVSRTGTTGGTYSAPAGLAISPSTGQITPSLSTPGTYLVTYTIAANNACPVYTATRSVTITPVPNASIAYTGSPFCGTAGTVNVALTGTTGGNFGAPNSVVIDSSSGAVNVNNSIAGNHVITYTVLAQGGCSAFNTSTSIVIDNTPPTITCPANITVNANASCLASGVALGSPIVNDNCGVANVISATPVNFPLGSTNVIWTVTDTKGNTANCTQTVTVIDVTPPTTDCPTDTVLFLNGNDCTVWFEFPVVPYSDNCGGASFVSGTLQLYSDSVAPQPSVDVTSTTGQLLPIGTHTVLETFTDAAGNSSTCSYTVTVQDTTPPWFVCPLPSPIILPSGANCTAVMPNLVDSVSHGDCSDHTWQQTPAPGTVVSGSFTCQMTFTDAHGNVSVNTDQVEVRDLEAPTITCPANIIVTLAPGACDTVLSFSGSATDNCGTVNMGHSIPSGSSFGAGTHTVVFSASDAAGNSSSCSFTIEVLGPDTAFLSYAQSAYCQGSGTIAPDGFGPVATNAYFAGPPGVAIDASTGEIDLDQSGPGTYSVGYVIQGDCDYSAWTNITINAPPNAGLDAALSICASAGDTSLFSLLGGNPQTGGTWSGPSPVTGNTYDPMTMDPGTYLYSVPGAPGCSSAEAEVSVTETSVPGTACNDGDPNTGNDTWDANCNCVGLLIDCQNIPGGSALPGTTCNDGDPDTGNDIWDANCNCAGQLIDCQNIPGGSALPGTACNDGDPSTDNDTWDASCNCVGLLIDCQNNPGGSALPGTACNDGDPSTGNDTWDASCNCVGQLIDCQNIPGGSALPGTACNDGDPSTGNDTWDASCNCVGMLIDCQNIPGGSALPGTACNDGDPSTGNDTWDASCDCVGQLIDCQNTPGGSALPGTACNDGDPNTGNDTWDANCNCAGQLIDCQNIPGGSALPGTACNDGDPNTGNDTWDANCNCAGQLIDCQGTPGGSALPGTACNDGDPNTGNDTWDANCNCAGQLIDCQNTPGGSALPGTACNDGDPNTGNDTWDANCNCVGQLIDCQGTPGGSALPGTACNDGDPNTGNDTWDASCNCMGQLIDCQNTPGGSALPGTACNDGDPDTGNDTWDASCNCVGQLIDCQNIPGGSALPGTACNDGDPNTGNDTWDANCNCVGQLIDCQGTPGGSALPGTACNDGDPNTGNDTWDASCNCVGQLIDCQNIPGGSALPGTACNDGDPNTGNDTWDASCNCVGQLIDCQNIPGGSALPGTACNDGDPNTGNDTWDANCNCVGQLIDCQGTPGGSALPGTACNDGDPDTGNDTWDANCNCVGQLIDCQGTPGGSALPGIACNDGDPNTGNDTWDANCNCVGLLIDCENIPGGTALPGTPCDDGDPGTLLDAWNANCTCTGCVPPTLQSIVHNGPICGSTPLELSVQVSGSAPFLYAWSGPNGAIAGGNSASVILSNAVSGTYSVTVSNGCDTVTVSTTVVVTPLPTAEAGPDATVCGTVHTMAAQQVQAVGTWSGPSGVSYDPGPSSADAVITVPQPGQYTFHWTVGDAQCNTSDAVTITFHSTDTAGMLVDAGEDQLLAIVSSTELEGITNAQSMLWSRSSGGGIFEDTTDPMTRVFGLEIGNNVFVLTASNGPCAHVSDTVVIHVQDLFIPQGFSPNGDGSNDRFEITGIQEFPGNQLLVFDRWGRKVLDRKDYDNQWNGRGDTGGELPDDTYFYVLNLSQGRTYNGYVILKR